MKALILVGGFGTRLRPLTLTQPKPLVEFANKPMVLHQIEALAEVGVRTVVLAVNEKIVDLLDNEMAKEANRIGIQIVFSVENKPMGTAGPIALARHWLDGADPFFVLNSDVVCNFPFAHMLAFHRAHGHEGTLAVTKVDEPSKYGVVVFDEHQSGSGRVERFVEKPLEYVGNKINAGMYVLNASVLDRIPAEPCSIEQKIFPAMCQAGELYAHVLPGFWMDVGQPVDYLKGVRLYLANSDRVDRSLTLGVGGLGDKNSSSTTLQNGTTNGASTDSESADPTAPPGRQQHHQCKQFVHPPVLIDPSALIGPGCSIGPNVCIGAGVHIADGVRIHNSTILPETTIGCHSFISSSIVGRKCTIGRWVRIENTSVIGEDVMVRDELYLNGASVLPHKSITTNVPEPKIIM